MDASDFRGMSIDVLQEELEKRRRSLLETRCQIALGEDVRPHQVRLAKQEIARILTVIQEQNAANAEAQQPATVATGEQG